MVKTGQLSREFIFDLGNYYSVTHTQSYTCVTRYFFRAKLTTCSRKRTFPSIWNRTNPYGCCMRLRKQSMLQNIPIKKLKYSGLWCSAKTTQNFEMSLRSSRICCFVCVPFSLLTAGTPHLQHGGMFLCSGTLLQSWAWVHFCWPNPIQK